MLEEDRPGRCSGLTASPARGLLLAVDCSTFPSRARRLSLPARARSRLGLTLGATLTLLAAGAAAAVVSSTRSNAEDALAAVTANPDAARVARVQVAKAKDALERGNQARLAGDTAHAALFDDLAFEWAGTAKALARAAELEARAAEVEKQAAELEARAKRALTLIEQTVARRGKALRRLQELGVEPEPAAPAEPAKPEQPEQPVASEVQP